MRQATTALWVLAFFLAGFAVTAVLVPDYSSVRVERVYVSPPPPECPEPVACPELHCPAPAPCPPPPECDCECPYCPSCPPCDDCRAYRNYQCE